jgi:signal transduction histidine kinase
MEERSAVSKQERERAILERMQTTRRVTLSRARGQLGQAVTEMLAGPIGALGEQLQSRGWLPPVLGGLTSRPISNEAHAGRMREVLERDRALVDTHLDLARPDERAPQVEDAVIEAEPAVQVREQVERAARRGATQSSSASTLASPRPKKRGCSEPIRTRTMAKLLLSQGHPERALSIYDALIADGATDPELLAEAEALRSLQT